MSPHILSIFAGGKIKLNYIQWGSGPDVIFLHGWGGSTDSFLGVARVLKDCRVTLVDFFGFGKTPHPDYPLYVEDYARAIVRIITKFRMTNVILVGHSFGGRVAIRLASKYGYLIDKVLITDGAGIKPRRGLVYYFKIFRHKLLNKLGIKHNSGSADYRALSGVMKETFKNVVNEDLTPELRKITLPVLLVWGDKDKDTPIYMAKRMYRKVSGSGLIIFKGAGHYAYLEGFPVFVSVLSQFISGGDYEVGNRCAGIRANRGGVVKISVLNSE